MGLCHSSCHAVVGNNRLGVCSSTSLLEGLLVQSPASAVFGRLCSLGRDLSSLRQRVDVGAASGFRGSAFTPPEDNLVPCGRSERAQVSGFNGLQRTGGG